MNIVTVLSSVSKIAVLAFVGIFAVLIYELYLFKKESKKKSKPSVPQFNENINFVSQSKVLEKESSIVKRQGAKIFAILGGLLVFLGIIIVITFFRASQETKETEFSATQPLIQFASSKGIRLFSDNFTSLNDDQVATLEAGNKIIIGVESINEADIDQARIRVNSQAWVFDDTTTKYDPKYNVYYKEYEIASDEPTLKIDAQLHSKSDGWLGD